MTKRIARFPVVLACFVLAGLLLFSTSVVRADVITVSMPLTTDSNGDGWENFYSRSTSVPDQATYLDSYLGGEWQSIKKSYDTWDTWVVPPVGSWLTPGGDNMPLGLYASRIDVGPSMLGKSGRFSEHSRSMNISSMDFLWGKTTLLLISTSKVRCQWVYYQERLKRASMVYQ
ncbi:MAG: hypothetical protein FWE95_01980 [Planctomycetaceae bacterium]|nr:hypothetical protein [Planctomycetaceae bacterium]